MAAERSCKAVQRATGNIDLSGSNRKEEMRNSNNRYIVHGIVSDGNERPLGNLLVRAYDRDMRSETQLGEAITDAKGVYRINYTAEQFATREKGSADLGLRVFTDDGRQQIYETDFDRIVFNASRYEYIDIVIPDRIPQQENEFDLLVREVTRLAGEIKIEDLEENDHQRDISFLSREISVAIEKLEYLVIAHRLSKDSNIEAPFFYALLRKKTLLKNNLDRSLRIRLSIDINTDITSLLYEAALTDNERIIRDARAAVKEMIVPDRTAENAKRDSKILSAFRQRAEEYYEKEHRGRIVSIVRRFVGKNKTAEIAKIFSENKRDPIEVLKKISDPSFFETDADATDARIAVALSDLIGSSDSIITEVKRSENIKKPSDLRKLAAIGRSGWKS